MNQLPDFKNLKILIVEDDIDNRNTIERILREGGVDFKHIEYTDNANKAKTLIDDFEPDVILLDIRILQEPGTIEDSKNSLEVIEKVQLYNYKNLHKIKILIISNTVNDKSLQEIISSEGKNIQNFLDKHLLSVDYEYFKEKLFRELKKVRDQEKTKEKIDYSFIRQSEIKNLKHLHFDLWKKIKEEILDEFERLNDQNANEHNIARQVINTAGQVVEMTVFFLEGKQLNIADFQTEDDEPNMRKRLNTLSGRKFTDAAHGYTIINERPVISRKACEFAYRAYNLRNQASHSPEMDKLNMNIFAESRFTKWDAAISLNLIMPLIIEYTALLEKRKDNDQNPQS